MMKEIRPFGRLEEARFVARPNRFTVLCEVEGEVVKAHMPNSGRLRELLLPDARLLVQRETSPTRATSWTVDAVVRDGIPVMLRTDRCNAVARMLLEQQLVPGLEDAEVVAAEVTHGSSRFDFLLRQGGSPGGSLGEGADRSHGSTRGGRLGEGADRSPGSTRGRSLGDGAGRSPGGTVGGSLGEGADRSPGSTRGRSLGDGAGRSPGGTVGGSLGEGADRSHGSTRGRSLGDGAGRSPGGTVGGSLGGGDLLLEVKSCTLFGGEVAMFPDAVTQRGARHVRELTELARSGSRAAVMFLVQHPAPRYFMPDLHVDLDFTRAFLESREHVIHLPLALEWGEGLVLAKPPRLLEIPWETIAREAEDRGSYVLVLHLAEDRDLEFGQGLSHRFRAGWYAYVGSAMRGLSHRVARHLRLRKKPHWHIDALRAVTRVSGHVLIRASDRLECPLASALEAVADFTVPRFGASDCHCSTHLFGFASDPLQRRPVHDVLAHFKIARLAPHAASDAVALG